MNCIGDQQLYEAIVDELNWDDGVCAIGIRVNVQDGAVVLSGQVCDLEQRMRAEAIARLVSGVRSVISELQVQYDPCSTGAVPLARRIRGILSGIGWVNADDIQVKVREGWITLGGLVVSAERKPHLLWTLQKMLGIREVIFEEDLACAIIV